MKVDFTEESQHLQVWAFLTPKDRGGEPYLGKRHTLQDLKWVGKSRVAYTKDTVYVLQSTTIEDISLSGETGSNSQKSTSHKRKLFDIDFIFLAGPRFPLKGTSPDSPATTAVLIFPAAVGSTTLSLQIRGQHWLTFSLLKITAAPPLAFGVSSQPTALGPSSSKKKKNSFVLKPQSWCIHTMLQGNKKPGEIGKGWNEACTFLHGLLDRGILLCISLL